MRHEFLNASRMRGLSLVETMVAITISLILMGGAITLFVNNKVAYEVNDNLSRLQENARFAMELLVKDLRVAGYFGCNNSPATVTNLLAGPLNDTTSPLEGLDDDTSGGVWSPSAAGGPGERVADTDAVTMRRLGSDNRTVIAATETTFEVPTAAGLDGGQSAAVSDCNGTTIFELTNVDHDTQILTHAGINKTFHTDGEEDNTENPRITNFIAVRYFIGDGVNGPALFREVAGAAATELVEGVENMQLLYGVDNTGDNVPDTYVPAGDPALDDAAEWESVSSVRIALLMRTLQEYGQDVDNRTYTLNDFEFEVPAPGDRFKRRVFNTTVLLRNRLT